MNEPFIIYFFIFILIILQSVSGVGILMIGTPLLLFFNFQITEVLLFLLPISIITSLLNIFIFKLEKKTIIKDIKEVKSLFFKICLPSIFLGLLFLHLFKDEINFKLIVSIVIILTLIVSNYVKNFENLNKSIKILILSLIGMIHGLTNSGGSLLSIFILSLSKTKNQTRYNITYYYFYLALFQFTMFIILFQNQIYFDYWYYVLLAVPSGVFLANIIIKYISEIFFRKIINILAFLAALMLLFNF
jgi:uncharacterized membrane protein YfcA